jgi:hypothetical protein
MKIVSTLYSDQKSQKQILGFVLWAMSPPKDYISKYGLIGNKILTSSGKHDGVLVAAVDDIFPMIISGRGKEEQQGINNDYSQKLISSGFSSVVFSSEIVNPSLALSECLLVGKEFTTSQFIKLLPKSKHDSFRDLTLFELFEFLWQLYFIKAVISHYNTTGLLGGIKSEFLYYAVRQIFKSQDIYLVSTVQ